MRLKALNLIDFYKADHVHQYPDNTEFVFSNFTCRSIKHLNVGDDFEGKVVFFGLQGVLQWLIRDLWNETFFHQPKDKVVSDYRRRLKNALGRDIDLKHIEDLHDLGYLPIRVKALAEGTRVKPRVPLWTIQNTRPEQFWLVNYLETQLSAESWKPITSATISYEYYRIISKYSVLTGVMTPFTRWQGHDFSMRGMSGVHDAANSGAGHLTSFLGTDTVPAIDYLEEFYTPHRGDTMLGGSVAATEHSVMCMGGDGVQEIRTFERLTTKVYPDGIASIVSDTWDFWQVITEYAVELKDQLMARDGKTVFRPDSGDPVLIICGDPNAEPGTPEYKGAVECLWETFGGTETTGSDGLQYRTLDSHVGLIYGDSITLARCAEILRRLAEKGFSAANIVFGIGSYTYQFVTRDSLGTAIKATFGRVNGEERELYKDPKTDDGVKKSAKGLVRVDYDDEGELALFDQQTHEQEESGELYIVFEDGDLYRHQGIDDVRFELHGEHF